MKGTLPVGLFSFSVKLRSSTASSEAVYSRSLAPAVSRAIQRFSEATTSREVTGCPSWNFSPSRRWKLQVRLSGEVSNRSTICGFGWSCESQEKSVS